MSNHRKHYLETNNNPLSLSSDYEKTIYKRLKRLLTKSLKLSGDFWNWPLAGYLTIPSMQRLMHINYIYDLQLNNAGSIMEFGVHFGSTLIQLVNMRSIKEPYNNSRHVYGFDTFSGFESTTSRDADAKKGDYSISDDYELLLSELCDLHESLAPKSHIKKYSILRGDASSTLNKLLEERKDIIVSLAIFDMDLYKPTKEVLSLLIPRLHKGSVLVFDELNCPHYPGETEALIDVIGLNNVELKRSPYVPYNSIFVWNS